MSATNLYTVKIGGTTYEAPAALVARSVRQQYRKLRKWGIGKYDARGVVEMLFLVGSSSEARRHPVAHPTDRCTKTWGPEGYGACWDSFGGNHRCIHVAQHGGGHECLCRSQVTA